VRRSRCLPIVAVGLALLGTACLDRGYMPITPPPPSKVAALQGHALTISAGVALALQCYDEKHDNHSCGVIRARAEDRSKVRAFTAESEAVLPATVNGRSVLSEFQRPSVFVIAGMAPGATRVIVDSDSRQDVLEVTVVP
jgi:hypothetical protein